MSAQLDADLTLIMRAEDRMSPEVQASIERVNKQYRQVNNTNRAVTRGFQLQHQTLDGVTRAMSDFGRIGTSTLHVLNSVNLMQIRAAETARNLREAQEAVNKAIAEYGPNSVQAQEAIREEMRLRQEAAQQRTQDYLQYAGIGLVGAQTAGQFMRTRTFANLASRFGPAVAGAGGAAALGAATGGTAAAVVGGALLAEAENQRLQETGETFVGKPTGYGRFARVGRGNKTQGTTIQRQEIHINTNEIGVTSDDIINGADVFGGD